MAAQNKRSNRRSARSFHKWIGLVSVLLVVVIAITGLALNHTGDLDLDGKKVDARWLLDWYRIAPKGQPAGFPAGKRWIAGVDGQWFFDGENVAGEGRLIGAGQVGDEFAAAGKKVVLALDSDGNLLEKLDSASLPPGLIERVGVWGENLAIETDAGQFLLKNWVEIERLDGKPANWFEPAKLPPDELEKVQNAYRGDGLSLYRVVLDLHSGRFFGQTGVIVYDLGAILFLILAVTGIWLGIRRRRT